MMFIYLKILNQRSEAKLDSDEYGCYDDKDYDDDGEDEEWE